MIVISVNRHKRKEGERKKYNYNENWGGEGLEPSSHTAPLWIASLKSSDDGKIKR
jgi:hypothetical protein